MSVWRAWVAKVSATESATALALFRIGMGLGTLYTVGSVVLRGLVPVLWIDQAFGGYRDLGEGPPLVALLGGPTPQVVWTVVTGALIGGALMVVGLGGRAASALALVCTNAAVNLNSHSGGSYDELLTNGLWLAVIGGGSRTLSLDAKLATGAFWPRVEVLAFPRWLVAWQLVLMYGTTGMQKLSYYWVPGGDASALYYILQQPEWHRRDMSWVAWLFPLTQVATTVTWLWEVAAPLWILAMWWSETRDRPGRLRAWSNRANLRLWFALTGVVMHAVIFVTMDVGPFSFLSLVFYVSTCTPDEWERWLRRPG